MPRSLLLTLVAALSLLAAGCTEPADAPQTAPRSPLPESAELVACPDGTMTVVCNDSSALKHVYNEHCTGKSRKSQWAEAYCDDSSLLVAACDRSTTDPEASGDDVCFAASGRVVGQTSNGTDTKCYKVVFTRTGFGKVTLQTMFPVANSNC